MNRDTILNNTAWIGLDRALGFAGALIASVSVARVVGPVSLGYYNYILWIASITSVLSSFGVPVATRKYVAEYLGKGDISPPNCAFERHCDSRESWRASLLLRDWRWFSQSYRPNTEHTLP